MTTRVTDVADEQRFEITDEEGTVLGVAEYRRRPGVVVFTHTEVDPAFEGHGVGSALAAGALDSVRESGERVVALCPFIRAYLERHPEYEDLTRR